MTCIYFSGIIKTNFESELANPASALQLLDEICAEALCDDSMSIENQHIISAIMKSKTLSTSGKHRLKSMINAATGIKSSKSKILQFPVQTQKNN